MSPKEAFKNGATAIVMGRSILKGNIKNNIQITHTSLNDNTVEGIKATNYPAFSVQYHPESSPGPHDSRYLFNQFIKLIDKSHAKKK